jgi:hypothetical protein
MDYTQQFTLTPRNDKMNDLRRPMFIPFENTTPSSSSRHSYPQHHHARRSFLNHNIKPPGKRREIGDRAPPLDSILISLCHQGKWGEVLLRCETHPQEASPVPLDATPLGGSKPWKRERKSTSPTKRRMPLELINYSDASECLVHQKTALGLVCSSVQIPAGVKLSLILALVQASPEQIVASQNMVGCTPLRNLIVHGSCSASHLAAVLETNHDAVFIQDMAGLTPIDHLAMRLHLDPSQHNMDAFRRYVDVVESQLRSSPQSKSSASPLIRLLSLAQSPGNNSKQGQRIFHAILDSTRYLLRTNPSRIHDKSQSSGCTVLHVALRNFGDELSLIQLLLETTAADTGASTLPMLAQRNVFGDLPLHVACAGGSPMPILKLILEQSLTALPASSCISDGPHSLLWSTNHAGYTPIDLEWMRHIEGGGGLYERRTFYPLEERGMRCQSSREEGMYQTLLRKAVGQVMTKEEGDADGSERDQCCFFFGALLDRIILIAQMAYKGERTSDVNQITDYLLHVASSLASGGTSGPRLPQPLLFLFHWMHPEQVKVRDDKGRLPLHYALMKSRQTETSPRECKDNVWVNMLLESYPEGAKVADKALRLPIHYALDSLKTGVDDGNDGIIDKLIHHHPESLERRDPKSGLYPFQQAVDLSDCFLLLRRAPNLVMASLFPRNS